MTITTDRRITTASRSTASSSTASGSTASISTASGTTARTTSPGSIGRRPRSATPTRRRGTVERRRYVLDSAAREGAHGPTTVHGLHDAQIDRAHREAKISWTAMVAGVVATAMVILGLVAVANLRAASLDSSPQSFGSPVAVEQAVDSASSTTVQ